MKESQIAHESGRFWVCREGPGHFKVLENVGTHSVVRGSFHYNDNPAMARSRAVEYCERRALLA